MDQNFLKRVFLGGFAAAILAAVLAGFSAFAITKQWLPQRCTEFLIPGITALAILPICFIADGKQNAKRLILNLGICCVYFTVCLVAKIAFFPGEADYMLINGAICAACGIAAALIPSAKRKKGTTHRRRVGK